jgi:hypothetical protein
MTDYDPAAPPPPAREDSVGVGRYLTADTKAREMAAWRTSRSEWDGVERPGRGFPDPGVLSLVDALNNLDGACTLQSCAGHESSPDEGGSDGRLWLWLDERRSEAFRRAASDLARHAAVWSTAIIWGRDGRREIVEIVFRRGRAVELIVPLCAILRAVPPVRDERLAARTILLESHECGRGREGRDHE